MKTRLFVHALVAAMVAVPAGAHHNMSALFDYENLFARTGVLVEVDWRNPHIYVWIDVQTDADNIEHWSFEGPPPGFFRNRDVNRANFEDSLGKTVAVEASRARDGSQSGIIRQITLADGTVVSACPQNC